MKKNREKVFITTIIIGVVAICVFVAGVFYATSIRKQYFDYISRISTSMVYARDRGGAIAHYDDKAYRLTPEYTERLYKLITSFGIGKKNNNEIREDHIVYDFKNDTSLIICETDINGVVVHDKGLLVCFIDEEGNTYSYDYDNKLYPEFIDDLNVVYYARQLGN